MKPPSDQPKMMTMLCSSARAPAAPHQQGDHGHGAGAAEHAGGGGEQAVDLALAFGEGPGGGSDFIGSLHARMFANVRSDARRFS